MNGQANTRISLLRGTGVDAFGDETDGGTVVASSILASLHERSQRQDARSDGGLRQVGSYTMRCRHDIDVRQDDRVKDESDGRIYVVVEVEKAPSFGRKVDVRCSLRRLSLA